MLTRVSRIPGLLRSAGPGLVHLSPLPSGYSSDSQDSSWFRSLFVRKVDPRKDAHSNLLSKRETSGLYKLQCEGAAIPKYPHIPSHHSDFSAGACRGVLYH
ncbi:hypothetical protein FKM82_024311 [Ascaphus truei]